MATHSFLVAEPMGYNSVISQFFQVMPMPNLSKLRIYGLYMPVPAAVPANLFGLVTGISPNLEDCPPGGGFGFLIVFQKFMFHSQKFWWKWSNFERYECWKLGGSTTNSLDDTCVTHVWRSNRFMGKKTCPRGWPPQQIDSDRYNIHNKSKQLSRRGRWTKTVQTPLFASCTDATWGSFDLLSFDLLV